MQVFSLNQSPRRAAKITGIAIVLMALAAGLAFGYLHPQIWMEGDAQATAANLKSKLGFFKMETALWLFMLFLDVVVSWSIWQFFRPNQKRLANWTFALRLAYSVVLAGAISQLVQVGIFNEGLSAEAIYHKIQSFEAIWSAGLILFGAHLFALGALVYRQYGLPKVWGFLLYIAGISYSLIHFLKAFPLISQHSLDALELGLSLPMTVAELGFGIWMWWRGAK